MKEKRIKRTKNESEKDLISVIIPMYNEENIRKNIIEVIKHLNELPCDYEIIIVDDGSKINCIEEAKKIKNDKIKVEGYSRNKGKGNALKYGFRFCKGNYIAFMDADLELPPHQIKDFYEKITDEKIDSVIGSKRLAKSQVHYPLMRRIMSFVFQMITTILFGLKVRDTQVGMKMFRREVLDYAFPKMLVKKYAFDVELLVLANKAGYEIREIPIRLDYRFSSTIRKRDIINMLIDLAAIFYRLKIIRYYDKKN